MTKRPFSLAANPFLKITIPFAIGILLFDIGDRWLMPSILVLGTAVCLIARMLLNKTYRFGFWHIFSNMSFFLAFALFGWLCSYLNTPNNIDEQFIGKEIKFSGTIEEIRQRDFSSDLTVVAQIGQKESKLRLTTIHNDYSVHVGDIITCRGSIEPITNVTNPYSFDYATYMKRQGILYECTLKKGEYSISGHKNSLHAWTDRSKQKIIHLIRLSGISNGAASLSIAFCTGDRRYMSDSDKQAFSQAGLAHILAVSGLHIGVITVILSALLFPVRGPRMNKFKFFTILACVWFYVVFTGLSNSAIRAAIMVSFVYASKIFLRKHSSLNALAASAFFILIFSPNAIYDVGFQLSFLSVTGILLWANNLLPRSSNPILNYASSSLSVTLAAQLATAPLIIYYFNSFPTSFFITNFVIVPLLPLILLLNVSAIAIAALGYQLNALTSFIDLLYEYMIQTSRFCIKYLPAANNLWIDGISAALLSASVLISGLMLKFTASRSLKYTCIILLCSAVVSFTASYLTTPKSGHFIASEYGSTDIVAFKDHKLYVLNSLNDTTLAKDFINNADKFLARHRFDSIVYDKGCLNVDGIRFSYPFAWINGKCYVFVVGNYRKHHDKNAKPTKVNYAILTRRYYNQLSNLPDYFTADTVIIPREIYKERRDTLIDYARKNKIPFRPD